jgi:hypothetical protein
VEAEICNCVRSGHGRLVDVDWGAVTFPESEIYVPGLGFVYLQSPLPSPVFDSV